MVAQTFLSELRKERIKSPFMSKRETTLKRLLLYLRRGINNESFMVYFVLHNDCISLCSRCSY